MELDLSTLKQNADPRNKVLHRAFRRSESIWIDKDITCENEVGADKFEHVLDTGEVVNQRSFGLCGLCAFLTPLRHHVIKHHNIEGFNFSVPYLLFYNVLETVNYFLHSLIDVSKEKNSEELEYLLMSGPKCDGFFWSCGWNIVEKYGLVPNEAMPHTNYSEDEEKISQFVYTLSSSAAAQICMMDEFSEEEYGKIRHDTLQKLYNGLCILLGTPPDSFDFCIALRALQESNKEKKEEEKEKKKKEERKKKKKKSSSSGSKRVKKSKDDDDDDDSGNESDEEKEKDGIEVIIKEKKTWKMTPKEFYDWCEFSKGNLGNMDTYITLDDDVRFPRNIKFQQKFDNNMVGKDDYTALSLSSTRFKDLVRTMIVDRKVPVWFGCDVNQKRDNSSGIMDDRFTNYTELFGIDTSTPFRDHRNGRRLRNLFTLRRGGHAMVFTGYDETMGFGRFRVENSWGQTAGKDGYHIVNENWVDEYVHTIIVPLDLLTQEEQKLWTDGPVQVQPVSPHTTFDVLERIK